jgi:uncharacterized protein YbjT (DUF2867 family)
MANRNQFVVVTGATGQQGGAAARHLLSKGWKVRALARDLNKPAAQALGKAGAEVVRADNDDRASLDAAFKGAYGVFSVQNYWLPNVGAEGEVRQGKAVADAARAAGVQHLVYTSVGAAHRGMGQAHFASKFEIEQYIKALALPNTILRPAAFMENFNWSRQNIASGKYSGFGLRPEKSIQYIAADDIGAFAALVFEDRAGWLGTTLELAGDERTEPQIAEVFSRVLHKTVTLEARKAEGGQPPAEQAAMFQFFNGEGYDADISALRKMYPPLKTLEQWIRSTGWS